MRTLRAVLEVIWFGTADLMSSEDHQLARAHERRSTELPVGRWAMRASRWGRLNSVVGRSAGRTRARTPSPRSKGSSPGAHRKGQCRDVGARALRAVFSSHDNWLSLSEAERDEWRGYFDRMLEWLHQFGCTPERNPWSMLLGSETDSDTSRRGGA
jgi:hypothetical protein